MIETVELINVDSEVLTQVCLYYFAQSNFAPVS